MNRRLVECSDKCHIIGTYLDPLFFFQSLMDEAFIAGLKPGPKQVEFYDRSFSGAGSFGLRLNPSGRKSFFLVFRLGRKRRRLTIGQHPEISLDEARVLAYQNLDRVLAGFDPAAEKKSWNVPLTVEELAGKFIGNLVDLGRANSTVREYQRILNREILPIWGKRRIDSILPSDIIFLMDQIQGLRQSNVMAARIRSLLSSLFSYAQKKRLIADSPVSDTPDVTLEESSLRYLELDEIISIWKHCGTESPEICGIFRLLILTGQKSSEVCSMRWGDLNINRWIVTDGVLRGKRRHVLTLPNFALEVLRRVQPASQEQNLFVFQSKRSLRMSKTSNGSDYQNVRPLRHLGKAAKRIQEKAGLEKPWSPADVRRSFPNLLLQLKVRPDVIERILNRHPGDSHLKGFYQNLDYDEDIKRALERWSRVIRESTHPRDPKKPDGKVVPLFG